MILINGRPITRVLDASILKNVFLSEDLQPKVTRSLEVLSIRKDFYLFEFLEGFYENFTPSNSSFRTDRLPPPLRNPTNHGAIYLMRLSSAKVIDLIALFLQ